MSTSFSSRFPPLTEPVSGCVYLIPSGAQRVTELKNRSREKQCDVISCSVVLWKCWSVSSNLVPRPSVWFNIFSCLCVCVCSSSSGLCKFPIINLLYVTTTHSLVVFFSTGNWSMVQNTLQELYYRFTNPTESNVFTPSSYCFLWGCWGCYCDGEREFPSQIPSGQS